MKKILNYIIATWTFIALAQPTLAAIDDVGPALPPPSETAAAKIYGTILGIINSVNNLLLSISGGIAVIMIIIGGIYYITGQPDIGKKILSTTVIGIVIVATYWSIMRLVISFLPIS